MDITVSLDSHTQVRQVSFDGANCAWKEVRIHSGLRNVIRKVSQRAVADSYRTSYRVPLNVVVRCGVFWQLYTRLVLR